MRKIEPVRFPLVEGTYLVGSRYSPVAVMVVRTSERLEGSIEERLVKKAIETGASIAGICTTANIGLEKVIINILSNPNIRYLIVTGQDDNAHKCGLAILLLHRYGIDAETRRIKCSEDRPCSKDEILEAVLPNIPPRLVETFRRQVKIIPALPVDDNNIEAPARKIVVGSRSFTLPVETTDRGFRIFISRNCLEEIVQFLVHACLQEWENRVQIAEIVHKYSSLIPMREVELYDPGAFNEAPSIEELIKAIEQRLDTSPEVQELTNITKHGILDLGWVVVGKFRTVVEGYTTLKKYIKEKGMLRPTRHGLTREVCAVVIYEEHPHIELEETDGKIIIKKIDTASLKGVGLPLLDEDYLKTYCEDFINGIRRGDYAYTYGERLRRFNVELVEKFRNSQNLVIDQLDSLVKNLEKKPLERYHLAVLWNPVLDSREGAHPPCIVLFQILLTREEDGEERMNLICYMRSHDLENAHIYNYYLILTLGKYIEKKIGKKLGRIIWIIPSCHIYITDRGKA